MGREKGTFFDLPPTELNVYIVHAYKRGIFSWILHGSSVSFVWNKGGSSVSFAWGTKRKR